jgi:hypothetical protein
LKTTEHEQIAIAVLSLPTLIKLQAIWETLLKIWSGCLYIRFHTTNARAAIKTPAPPHGDLAKTTSDLVCTPRRVSIAQPTTVSVVAPSTAGRLNQPARNRADAAYMRHALRGIRSDGEHALTKRGHAAQHSGFMSPRVAIA